MEALGEPRFLVDVVESRRGRPEVPPEWRDAIGDEAGGLYARGYKGGGDVASVSQEEG